MGCGKANISCLAAELTAAELTAPVLLTGPVFGVSLLM